VGLHVSSVADLGEINTGLEKIKYYLYFLNYYQFSDEVVDAFLAELPELEQHFARLGNAVVITSIENVDFYSETLNWHNICGIDPAEFGPALLICTLPPANFGPDNRVLVDTTEESPWVLLPLKQVCETKDDIISLLKKLVSSIKSGAPIQDFAIDEIYKYKDRPIISGKKLEYRGIEFDLEEAWKKASSRIKKIKGNRPPK